MVILGKTKVKTALDAHPELRNILIELSPKFSKLNNPLIYKTVAKWATFEDVAKIGNISICVLLHKLNEKIGETEALIKAFPECIDFNDLQNEEKNIFNPDSYKIIEFDTRTRDDFFLPELTKLISNIKQDEAVKIISTFDPIPLKKKIESMDFKYSTKEVEADLFETFVFQKIFN